MVGLPKETVTALMILYRKMKVKWDSPDGDTDFFDIVAGVLQGDTLAPYVYNQPRLHILYIDRSNKKKMALR